MFGEGGCGAVRTTQVGDLRVAAASAPDDSISDIMTRPAGAHVLPQLCDDTAPGWADGAEQESRGAPQQ